MSYYDLSDHITLPNAAMKPAILVRERGLANPPGGPNPPTITPTTRPPVSSTSAMGTRPAPVGGPQPAQTGTPGTRPAPVGGPQPPTAVNTNARPAPVGGPAPAQKVYRGSRPRPGGIV